VNKAWVFGATNLDARICKTGICQSKANRKNDAQEYLYISVKANSFFSNKNEFFFKRNVNSLNEIIVFLPN